MNKFKQTFLSNGQRFNTFVQYLRNYNTKRCESCISFRECSKRNNEADNRCHRGAEVRIVEGYNG